MSLRLEEAGEEGTLESNLPPCSMKLALLPVIWVKWYKILNSPMALNFTCSKYILVIFKNLFLKKNIVIITADQT